MMVMVIVLFFHLTYASFVSQEQGGNRTVGGCWGATSIWGSGVTVVRGVSPLSLQPPGLGFTANPLPISLSSYPFYPPLCGLFSHGQNATKIDQGSGQVFSKKKHCEAWKGPEIAFLMSLSGPLQFHHMYCPMKSAGKTGVISGGQLWWVSGEHFLRWLTTGASCS